MEGSSGHSLETRVLILVLPLDTGRLAPPLFPLLSTREPHSADATARMTSQGLFRFQML